MVHLDWIEHGARIHRAALDQIPIGCRQHAPNATIVLVKRGKPDAHRMGSGMVGLHETELVRTPFDKQNPLAHHIVSVGPSVRRRSRTRPRTSRLSLVKDSTDCNGLGTGYDTGMGFVKRLAHGIQMVAHRWIDHSV